MAEDGQQKWPSEALDVPSDPAGLSHYQRLRQVRRCFSDVAYRASLTVMATDAAAQQPLLQRAWDEAADLLSAREQQPPER